MIPSPDHPLYTRATAPEPTMHALVRRLVTTATLFATLLLASCGQTSKPSPLDAALNAPEGTVEKAPPKPTDLKPPALPPNPGHIGRN